MRELLGVGFHKVFYDCYVASSMPITEELRAEAALGVSPPGSHASHFTAARLWDGVVPDDPDVHVRCPAKGAGADDRGSRRTARSDETPTTRFRGIPISTPEQTFLELAALGFDLVALVVLGDSLIKAGRTTVLRLTEFLVDTSAQGALAARNAVRYVRENVDSPMESRLRMLLVLAGLPEPTINLILRNADGSWRRRFDMCFPDLKLIIEYDGRQHAGNTRQWQGDLRRREELDALGWRIIVVTADDLYHHPEDVLDRVREAMTDRGATGIRRRFRNDWRRYFA